MTAFNYHLVTAFFSGAVIGSFLNVVIHRLPRGGSIIHPPSHCPHCKIPIPPFHNIPIVSWLFLRGRCHHCRQPISFRYPLVETVTALYFLCIALSFGITLQSFVWALYGSSLIAVTGIDIDHKIIPDVITLPGMVLGLALSFILPITPWDSLLGLLAGGGFFYAVAEFSERVLGKAGMGGGDIKLTAMMGAFLGLESLVVAVFIALFTGSVMGITLIATGKKTRKDIIPFGPFLALGGIVCVFFGSDIVSWYLVMSGY